ncbi:peroxidase [Drosophila persimilis]|uniref:peroxidase n=1 Tax=Drosophila persimilis TaxID=7234 RepID=UPI000F07A66E|nr:peroxidase [Drosophila persimilis]
MRGSKLILKVLAVFGVLAIADKSTATTSCPYANSDKLELYPASKSKRSSESFRFEVRPAVSGSNLDLLLKEYLPKYNTNSDSSPSSWLDLSGSSQPVRCGIPPLNCLNDTINLHYRSIDGSCNSLLYPEFGIAVSRYRRLLPPKYGKPVQALPNARLISLSLYGEHTRNDNFRTMAAMQWGQYVAHDISQLTTKGAPKDCCAEPHHHRCQPIALPRGGPIAYNTGKTCLHFANSVSDADAICPKDRAPYPEKLTLSTAYLDLSSVYGNSLHQSRRVRLFKGGRLRTSYINGQHWLPVSQNFEGECGSRNECYSMPDRRNRFSPTIALLQTLLVREHNRLVENLALLNPHYSDERLYQEARKISIAQFQKITFNDWLPLYLGRTYTYLNGLIYPVDPTEYVNDYDETVNAGAYAEFAAAAFRYAHTQIPGWFSLVAPNRSSNQTLRLSDYFERSETIRLLDSSDNFDALLRGLATQLHKRSDGNIDPEIKHFFNRKDFEEYGSDLKSLDIQRARDFGLASYNDVREFCGLRRAVDWPDFTAEIPREKIALLKKLYATPDDVELSVGGSLEFHVPEALFGPTLLCIIGKQFLNTRRGDRFFFERDHTGGFSRTQLAEIRKASLASLFCNNANYLRDIQPNVFVFPNVYNMLVNCNEIPQVDLSKWQDTQ